MGRVYTLTPKEPPWHFDPTDFGGRIKNRWPFASAGIGDMPGSPMAMYALIPADPMSHELGIALDAEGWVVILDPADPDSAVEVTLWYLTQLPGVVPPVHPDLPAWHSSITFDYAGEPTEYDPDRLRLTAAQARQLARTYVRTGKQPTTVAWRR